MRLIHTIARERLPFPLEEYENRVDRLRFEMEKDGLGGLIICGAPKRSGYVRYIANFESYIGTTFVIIPISGPPILVTDSQFRQEPMQAGIWMTWIEEVRHTHSTSLYVLNPSELLVELEDAINWAGLTKSNLGFVGEERLYPDLHKGLRAQIPPERWKDGTDLFHRVASQKSPAEIDLFIRFGKIIDNAINEFLDALTPGITESELFGIISGSLFRQGVQNFFGTVPPFLVSGERTRFKSVSPSSRKVSVGDPIFFDLEPELDGYYLDISRSLVMQKAPDAICRLIEVSQSAEQAVFENIKPGVSIRFLQNAALNIVREAGLEHFYYFKVHGQSTMRPAYPLPGQLDFIIEAGMVFTLESILVDPYLTTGTIENAYLVTMQGAKRLVKNGLDSPMR